MCRPQRALRVILSALLVFVCPACSSGGVASTSEPAVEDVVLGGETFHLRLAINDAQRQKGLGGVASLAPDAGMLFVFPDAAPRSFWMYGCTIDLDIAYVSPLGRVVSVYTMPKEAPQAEGESVADYSARLLRYPSGSPARYVIEVQPGTLARLGITVGTMLELDRERLKTLAH